MEFQPHPLQLQLLQLSLQLLALLLALRDLLQQVLLRLLLGLEPASDVLGGREGKKVAKLSIFTFTFKYLN